MLQSGPTRSEVNSAALMLVNDMKKPPTMCAGSAHNGTHALLAAGRAAWFRSHGQSHHLHKNIN